MLAILRPAARGRQPSLDTGCGDGAAGLGGDVEHVEGHPLRGDDEVGEALRVAAPLRKRDPRVLRNSDRDLGAAIDRLECGAAHAFELDAVSRLRLEAAAGKEHRRFGQLGDGRLRHVGRRDQEPAAVAAHRNGGRRGRIEDPGDGLGWSAIALLRDSHEGRDDGNDQCQGCEPYDAVKSHGTSSDRVGAGAA